MMMMMTRTADGLAGFLDKSILLYTTYTLKIQNMPLFSNATNLFRDVPDFILDTHNFVNSTAYADRRKLRNGLYVC